MISHWRSPKQRSKVRSRWRWKIQWKTKKVTQLNIIVLLHIYLNSMLPAILDSGSAWVFIPQGGVYCWVYKIEFILSSLTAKIIDLWCECLTWGLSCVCQPKMKDVCFWRTSRTKQQKKTFRKSSPRPSASGFLVELKARRKGESLKNTHYGSLPKYTIVYTKCIIAYI